jgi:PAS domain S-box-containing protein
MIAGRSPGFASMAPIPHRPTALVVNDEPSQLRLIGAVLEKAGIDSRTCEGVEQALSTLQQGGAVDLIVTDLHMPGIDGWQFCQLLRSPEFAAFNALPVLVVSATYSGSDAERLSLDLGADAFLSAPFAPSALQHYAKALLRGERPAPAPQALIVHGDAAEAARLSTAFAEQGYQVEVAHRGGDALRLWEILQPDVAVIDDGIAEPNATAVLAGIKRPGSRTVAFAICNDPVRDKLQLARQGADGSLRAPADTTRLIALCETVRRQRSLLRFEQLLEERGRALRDSEARWRSLFEAIPEIVVVHDDAGVIRHINRTGAERLGWPAHELIGRTVDDFLRDERDAAGDGTAPARNGDAAGIDAIYVARSGVEIPVEVNRCRMSFDGQPAVLSVARDVSVRRELARQRKNFLAMLTHDIKNPLAIVLGFTDLLGEIGPLSDEQRDLVGRMQANANTVLTLVANYLNLTQIENGQLALTKRPTAVAEVITDVVERYRAQARQQDIELRCAIEDGLGLIAADPVALERVLTNLVHNALKFTGESGVVEICARRSVDAIAITVRDTGIGIRADDLPTIFQPYRRGTLREAREGVGLGLFIAQSLVQAHQGRIAVESAPGKGTTFSVFLPTGDPIAMRAVAGG